MKLFVTSSEHQPKHAFSRRNAAPSRRAPVPCPTAGPREQPRPRALRTVLVHPPDAPRSVQAPGAGEGSGNACVPLRNVSVPLQSSHLQYPPAPPQGGEGPPDPRQALELFLELPPEPSPVNVSKLKFWAQKCPSPMETGAGSSERSRGISEAIRGNLTASRMCARLEAQRTHRLPTAARHKRDLFTLWRANFACAPAFPALPPLEAAGNCS